jgi:hypothetical protein
MIKQAASSQTQNLSAKIQGKISIENRTIRSKTEEQMASFSTPLLQSLLAESIKPGTNITTELIKSSFSNPRSKWNLVRRTRFPTDPAFQCRAALT